MRKAAHAMNPPFEMAISPNQDFEVIGQRVVV
jgi:hypothetical protein